MYYIHICSCVIGHKALRAVASLLWTMMRTGKNEREGESERKTCERGFMSVCSAVILIMAPDSRVQYSEARAGRQVQSVPKVDLICKI